MAFNQTVAFIGCGNMGSAILSGLLDTTRTQDSTETPRISRFIVSTKTEGSANRLRARFAEDESRLHVQHDYNVQAMKEADIILLGCKPYFAEQILREKGVREALSGKFVISVLAGKTPEVLQEYIGNVEDVEHPRPYVVRAIPNVAARINQSMTIIEDDPTVPADLKDILVWIFEQVGKVKFLAGDLFNAGAFLVGSSMAVLSVGLDGILDGCVAEGIRRPEALEMAAQGLLGMAELLRQGEHPAVFRESISSPRGCTIGGLITVEKAGVRGTFAQSVIDGTAKLN